MKDERDAKELPDELKPSKLLFRELERTADATFGLLFFVWITLLLILWRVW